MMPPNFPHTCPRCGWIVDYSCGCADGRTEFPLVDYDDPRAVEARKKQTTLNRRPVSCDRETTPRGRFYLSLGRLRKLRKGTRRWQWRNELGWRIEATGRNGSGALC